MNMPTKSKRITISLSSALAASLATKGKAIGYETAQDYAQAIMEIAARADAVDMQRSLAKMITNALRAKIGKAPRFKI